MFRWCIAVVLAGSASLAAPPKPPNIVFVFTDDHAYAALSAYGDSRKLLDTPNIDRIAKTGMRLDRCLVPNSICGPSRATVLTGKHSHANGFFNNSNSKFDGTQVTFPKLLQEAGYQTALIGKWHLVSDPTGFDHWNILPGQGIYYNPPMVLNGTRTANVGYVTDLITDFSTDWIKKRDKDKPFLLMCQHKAPHREWAPAVRHLGHDADRKYPEPPTLFDDYAGRGDAERASDMSIEKTMTDLDLKLKPPPGINTEDLKAWNAYYEPRNAILKTARFTREGLIRWKYNRYLHDYLACIKAVDEGVGKLLDTLEAEGLAENTIVIYASDQGFYLGEHGWFDKRWIFEESLRTPCLMRIPGVTKPGTTSKDITSNLDFAPTILQACGLPVPAAMHGRSLIPLLKGNTPADWRKSFYYHYYENPGPHDVAKHYGVVTDRHKLVHFYEGPKAYWELFDRQTDPQELKSVFNDPAYADARKTLEAELTRLRTELKVPDPDPPETMIRTKAKK